MDTLFNLTNKFIKKAVAFLLVGAMSVTSIYVYAEESHEETTTVENVNPEINTENPTEEISEIVDSDPGTILDVLEENIPEPDEEDTSENVDNVIPEENDVLEESEDNVESDISEESTSEEPASEELASEEPASEELENNTENDTSDESTSEESVSEEPASEESEDNTEIDTSEESISEESTSEEPASEESASEEFDVSEESETENTEDSEVEDTEGSLEESDVEEELSEENVQTIYDYTLEEIAADEVLRAEFINSFENTIFEETVNGSVVTISGLLPEGTSYTIEDVTDYSLYENLISEAIRANYKVYKAYDINLYYHDEIFEPNEWDSFVTVSINDISIDMTVYRIEDDNTVTNIDSEQTDDNLSFNADHFTVYALGATRSAGTTATLKKGELVNVAIKKLVNSAASSYWTGDTTITDIKWSETPFTSTTEIQSSGEPVYIKLDEDGQTVLLYSSADTIYFNSNSSVLFAALTAVEKIDLSRFDTSLVTDYNNMFSDCESLKKIDLSNFNLNGPINIQGLFFGCLQVEEIIFPLNMDLSEIEVNGNSLNLLGYASTPSVKILRNLKANVSSDGLKVPDMDVPNTGSLKNLYYVIDDNNDGIPDTEDIFDNEFPAWNESHTYIRIARSRIGDFSIFNTRIKQLVSSTAGYSTTDNYITKISFVSTPFTSDVEVQAESTDYNENAPIYARLNGTIVELYSPADVVVLEGDYKYLFYEFRALEEINFDIVRYARLRVSISRIFSNCKSLSNISNLINKFDTENVTDMSYMFSGCESLTSLDISNFNMGKVNDMGNMFASCNSLTTLKAPANVISLASNKSASFPSGSGYVWYLDDVDPEFEPDTNTTYTAFITEDSNSHTYIRKTTATLKIGILINRLIKQLANSTATNNSKDSIITSMIFVNTPFANNEGVIHLEQNGGPVLARLNGTTIEIYSDADIIYANADSSRMFYYFNALTSLDISWFDTSNVTNMERIFSTCSNLASLNVSDFNTSKVTDMSFMFDTCKTLTTLNVSGFVTNNVTNMNSMFSGCKSLTSLDVSGFVTNNVTNMCAMFDGCKTLTTLNVSGFVTNKVTTMSRMFSGCESLANLDVSGFVTNNVTNMYAMFDGCKALTTLDVSNFVTNKVTDMSRMFCDCKKLPSLDVSEFDTSSVTNMNCMFMNCQILTSLDVNEFNTSNVTNMGWMFTGCYALATLDISMSNICDIINNCSICVCCISF